LTKPKRAGLIAGLVFLLLLFGAAYWWNFFYRYNELDYCWQCGAKRVRISFRTIIVKTPICLRSEAILGHECEHQNWALIYEHHVPLLTDTLLPGEPLDYIELLPDRNWQQQALRAIGDPNNRLKWLDLVVLRILAQELGYQEENRTTLRKLNVGDGQDWWAKNRKYFQIVEDKQEAQVLFNELSVSLEKESDEAKSIFQFYNSYIQRDLTSNGENNVLH
jgi:hypothetical protein